MKKHKFKIGDRVVYRWRGKGGRCDLDGMHGTVVSRHDFSTHFEYAVKFDGYLWTEWMDLKRFNIPDGYGWSCTEEHLDKEDSDTKKQEKEEENTMAKRIDWASADFVIKRMSAEGKTQEEIAEKIGCSKSSIADRVALLKRIGGDEAVDASASRQKVTEQKAVGETPPLRRKKEGAEKADLNELEETLAAVISEQKEEIDHLQGRVNDLEKEVAARAEEVMEAKRMAVRSNDRTEELESELKATQEALEIAEDSMDEERQQKELLAKELTAAREALESKEVECMEAVRETLRRYDVKIKEITEERDRYLRLAIRLSESVVGL